ncbi:hypothetical protein F5J12DRAFT_784798 [Pisolithus orientalis]|uniref:uncharacterized protein n=1 Tax=Pisolithus orientalis TaxID=936130 RepID=UPI0022240DC9|nr:uncharacterized protein F5J12DRAFT_784798 [Pisolithus orientalis]KAI5998954.1 hypothetical protein F5J12DRAFT_784798 [Pisolithus orientalis]
MPCMAKGVDQVTDNSMDLHTWVLQNCKIPTTKMAPPPEIRKDKPKPWHMVQLPEGWEEHMFSLHDRRRSLTPSVSVSSQNSTTPILQEDQVESALMEEDAGEAEAEEVEVNIQADEGSQCPDDGASQLLDDEVLWMLCCYILDSRVWCPLLLSSDYEDGSESSLPPSSPPAEDSNSNAEDEFPPHCPGCCVEHKPKSKGKSRAMDVDNSDIASQDDHEPAWNAKFKKTGNLPCAALNEIHDFAAKEKLKAVYEWSESSSAVPTNKSIRVHNMKMQFSRLAEVWSALEDIKIAGVVMMPDLWHIWWFQYHMKGLMDKYTAIFKCLKDGNGTEAGLLGMSASASSAAALELHCRMKEIPRDHNCWVFGSMMKEKLITALKDLCMTCGVEVGDPQKIIWQQLLEFIRRNSLVIINWLLGVPPPGPGFEYKKLKVATLCQLVVPYLWRKLGSMYNGQSDDDDDDDDDEKNDHLDGVPEVKIKPWNEDVISIGDAHPLKGETALVKAPDGTVLCKVSDNPKWQKSHKEGDPGRDACPIAGDHGVVVDPAAFWLKLTGDMHRMHLVTHQHAQAARTLESPVNLSAPCQLGTMGICIMMLSQAVHTCGTLALLSSFHHLGIMSFSIAQPTAQQWVDRGSAAQYEDEFPEDYIDY